MGKSVAVGVQDVRTSVLVHQLVLVVPLSLDEDFVVELGQSSLNIHGPSTFYEVLAKNHVAGSLSRAGTGGLILKQHPANLTEGRRMFPVPGPDRFSTSLFISGHSKSLWSVMLLRFSHAGVGALTWAVKSWNDHS